jgi:hypothetical protein
MRAATMTPRGAVVRGCLAAAVGTAAMDCLWYWRYRRRGGSEGFLEQEFSAGIKDWESAGPPAQVGRRIAEGVFQIQLPPERARLVNNVMHWTYGQSWGALYGIVAGSLGEARIRYGVPFGTAVFAGDYVVLPLAKLYKPLWEYDGRTVWEDYSAHLVFGVATAATFRFLSRR